MNHENLFTVGNTSVTIQDLDVVCHVCRWNLRGGRVVVRPASIAVMNGPKGVLERMFMILGIDARACVHIRAMRWLRIRRPLRHLPERCDVLLLPVLSNPPPVPSYLYEHHN